MTFYPVNNWHQVGSPPRYPVEITTVDTQGQVATNKMSSQSDFSLIKKKIRNIIGYKYKVLAPPVDEEILKACREIYLCYGHFPHDVKKAIIDGGYDTGTSMKVIVEAYKAGMSHKKKPKDEALLKWKEDFCGEIRYEPGLDDKYGNSVLAVRSANDTGGRRVITSKGHSMAYTDVRAMYHHIKADGSFVGLRNTREYVRSNDFIYSYKSVRADKKNITIGCQTIPYSALKTLAKEEGWNK